MPDTDPQKPSDEAPPGTPGSGENLCKSCGGTGKVGPDICAECSGTGTITEGIGGG